MIAGKNVATINDKNNNDWVTKGAKNSFDINPPTNKLFEKSGEGNSKNPPIKPMMIET